ncbi:MAG: DeoR/GlpR family DNA-binding transcription regulator [Sporolactobacillus sp.]
MSSTFDFRKAYILAVLKKEKHVSVRALSDALEVTPETIRRDLSVLERQKLLLRMHGGATRYSEAVTEPLFVRKTKMKKDEKQRIGAYAAQTIQDGDTVLIDSGTTTLALCEALAHVYGVTFLTHSLAAAWCLNRKMEQGLIHGELILLGGTVYAAQRSIKGSLTEHMLANFKVNKAYISCGGVNPSVISDYDTEECLISAMMIDAADESYLLADASKLGKQTFCVIKPLAAVDHIICDQQPDPAWLQHCNDERILWHTV